MQTNELYFIEPSKVGPQHITLLQGYLKALQSSNLIMSNYRVNLCASSSTLSNISPDILTSFNCINIQVMNPENRRLILKSLLELFNIMRFSFKLKPHDVLFVSCLLPTSLVLFEILNFFFRKKKIYVVLHGEIEGLFRKETENFLRIGYWAKKWIKIRKTGSSINLVVLDDFIKEKMLKRFPAKLNNFNLFVVHHPILPLNLNIDFDYISNSVCFIGYRTKYKGFSIFESLASKHLNLSFLAIGGGKVENIISSEVKSFSNGDDFIRSVAQCNIAIFPYTDNYSCSLSAAALDALAAGVYIVALREPFFASLESYFGSDLVKTCSTAEEMSKSLDHLNLLSANKSSSKLRIEKVLSSKYSLQAVKATFEELLCVRI